jgi:hypothetical protein
MFAFQWELLFYAGVLLSLGAYLGYARVFAGALGIFTWFVLGNAATATQVVSAGTTVVTDSTALAWLCYVNAAVHALALFIGFAEWYGAERDRTDNSQRLDPAEVIAGGR